MTSPASLVLKIFTLFLMTLAIPAADSIPASGNIPGSEYPRLGADRSVTFRLKAPEAKTVKLNGGAGLIKEPTAMTRGADGNWSITTPPAAPGFHYYWFTVDDVRVTDPNSFSYFGYGRETSGVEIPEPGADFYSAQDVPHGEVRIRPYFSKTTGQWRRAFIYTPPNYDQDSRARFPVLYLLHGAGENERGWTEQGRANFILDNLIAAKKARPMIVVMDTGYASIPNAAPATNNNNSQRTAAFQQVLLTEIIPLIDATYRTRPDRENRAMAGLSMGSGQALNIALRHLDQFAWIAGMSGVPAQNFDAATAYDGAFRDAAAFNKKVKLLWFSAGTAETRMHNGVLQLHEALDKAGIKHGTYISEGTDHEWQTWRRSLHELAPRLFGK